MLKNFQNKKYFLTVFAIFIILTAQIFFCSCSGGENNNSAVSNEAEEVSGEFQRLEMVSVEIDTVAEKVTYACINHWQSSVIYIWHFAVGRRSSVRVLSYIKRLP